MHKYRLVYQCRRLQYQANHKNLICVDTLTNWGPDWVATAGYVSIFRGTICRVLEGTNTYHIYDLVGYDYLGTLTQEEGKQP